MKKIVLIGILALSLSLLGCSRNQNGGSATPTPSQTRPVDALASPAPQADTVSEKSQDIPFETQAPSSEITVKNTQYGFDFTLPASWEGYSIISGQWEGLSVGDQKVVQSGPMLSIRHPQWTPENPRQDIPIMIFTLDQWDALQREEFHIGAAPIGPSELGRNSRYVFALPARYNFAFPTGYEEVESIMSKHPLHPTEDFSGAGS